MNDDELDSDEQGEKGQAQFRLICIDAKFTCNEAHRDRAGFDFILNDRIVVDGAANLDKRHAPLSCLVQVKSIKNSREEVKLRLSSLEQIAKDLKPSFIYIFRIQKDGNFGNSIIMHLHGLVLEKILKKLRSEEAAGRTAVNNAYISLSISNGVEIQPSGPSLRTYLTETCGDNPEQYTAAKIAALKSLGYEGKPFAVKMVLELSSVEEYIDVMLGLKSDVPAKITSQKETRFGITLEKEDLSNVAGALSVQPKSFVRCSLVVRRDKFSDPVVFNGDIVLAPSLFDQNKIGGLHFKSRLVKFTAKISEQKFSINLKTLDIEEGTLMSCEEWVSFFSLAQAVSQDGFSISLQPEGVEPLVLPNAHSLLTVDEEVVAFDIQNAKRLRRLAEMAGAKDDISITYTELCQQADNISSGFAILNRNEEITPLSFEIEPNKALLDIPDTLQGMHVNFVCCGKDLLAWSALVTLNKIEDKDRIKFVSKSVDFDEMARIPSDKYPSFVEKVRDKVGAGVLMAREISKN